MLVRVLQRNRTSRMDRQTESKRRIIVGTTERSSSWSTRKASGVTQPQSKGLRTGGLTVQCLSLGPKPRNQQSPCPRAEKTDKCLSSRRETGKSPLLHLFVLLGSPTHGMVPTHCGEGHLFLLSSSTQMTVSSRNTLTETPGSSALPTSRASPHPVKLPVKFTIKDAPKNYPWETSLLGSKKASCPRVSHRQAWKTLPCSQRRRLPGCRTCWCL